MPIREALRRDLRGLSVITDPEALQPYSHDESFAVPVLPLAVVAARSPEDVVRVLRWADAQGVPVTPRGAGSGQSGGCIPESGGIVLSTAGMTAIRSIDTVDLTAVVEPGVVTGALQAQVEEHGLFYPPDPASLAYCTLGGNVAENAGGPRALKYGVTRDYVLGLEIVLMGGERMRIGRQTIKGVAGYDLVGLVTGSEGTLAVVTEITLQLIPLPVAVETALAFFASTAEAAATVARLLAAGITPRTLEYMDATSLAAVRPKAEVPVPETVAAALLIEIDGPASADLQSELQRIAEVCTQGGAVDVRVAQGERQRRVLWSARRLLSPALKEAYRFKVAEDAVVPRSRLPDIVAFFSDLGRRIGVSTAAFGHAGDGNLHLNFLFDHPEQRSDVDGAVAELFRAVVKAGGTISGEHGIGLTKKNFLPIEQSASVLALQKAIKRTFDPKGLLNPSKLFQ